MQGGPGGPGGDVWPCQCPFGLGSDADATSRVGSLGLLVLEAPCEEAFCDVRSFPAAGPGFAGRLNKGRDAVADRIGGILVGQRRLLHGQRKNVRDVWSGVTEGVEALSQGGQEDSDESSSES